jgi:uncharacterized membrane protein
MLAATFAAPALAQSFSFGLHLYAGPNDTQPVYNAKVAEDGSAVGATFYPANGPNGSNRFGARIEPSGMVNFPDQIRVFDISDNGAYTTDYVTRRSASGVVDVLVPGVTRPRGSEQLTHISGNGSVVAGSLDQTNSSDFIVGSSAFRWTEQSGLQNLPDYRPGAIFTSTKGISRDGSTIVGVGRTEFFGYNDGWKWTESGGFSLLPGIPGALAVNTEAHAVNGDGTIIVGQGAAPVQGTWAHVWQDDQVRVLPPLPGYRSSVAYDLSDDGSLITGTLAFSDIGLPQIATIWTESTNWVPALDFFRTQGVDIPDYLSSIVPIEVSADGRTFSTRVLDTRTSQEYIAVIAIPSPGVVPALMFTLGLMRPARARRVR